MGSLRVTLGSRCIVWFQPLAAGFIVQRLSRTARSACSCFSDTVLKPTVKWPEKEEWSLLGGDMKVVFVGGEWKWSVGGNGSGLLGEMEVVFGGGMEVVFVGGGNGSGL